MINASKKNKIKSFFIISIFTVILSLIVYAFCMLCDLGIYGAIIGIIFSAITSLVTYYNSDKIVLNLNGARTANYEEEQRLYQCLDNLCMTAQVPMPKLYMMDDDSPNAFATGRNPENSVICVTTGLMRKLDREELEGVLAHELSHIKNYDILLQTIASVFVSITTILSDFFLRITLRGARRNNDNDNSSGGLLAIIGMILLFISPIIAPLLKLALSRRREYLADSSAAELTNNPNGLIQALRKISSDPDPLEQANKSTAGLYFSNPLTSGVFRKLYSTHPPIEDRIKALENMN